MTIQPEPRGAQSVIADADFERFRDFFYRRTGIRFESSKRYFVDKRLLERMRATGRESFRAYFTFMRFQPGGEELQALINAMTVNETYFFREAYQFDCLVEEVLDEIVDRSPREHTLRIWSVPSSTGEEPYGIALYLLDRWPRLADVDVEIVSSDIDSAVLERCREGRYGARSVQHLPPAVLERWFEREGPERWRIHRDLREAVTFTRVNLADPVDTRPYRGFDVIFCRNLLIYFDDASRRQAAEVFFDALGPGGFVFLGHSESMSRISSLFRVRKFRKAMVYQKPFE